MTRPPRKSAFLYDTGKDPAEERGPPQPSAEEAAAAAAAATNGASKSKKAARVAKKPARRPKLDRDQISDALTKLGHEPSFQVVDGQNASLLAIAKVNADLIFNLTESYAGD